MTNLRRPISLFATVALVLAACGGGSGGGGESTTSAASGGADATSGPTEAAPAEATAEPAGGGGTASGVCELVTADELTGILKVPVTMTVLAGPPDNCIIDGADGVSLAAWSFTLLDKDMYELFLSGSDVMKEPGMGDGVMYQPEAHQMTLFKAGAMVVIGVYASAGSDDERLEVAKQIGAIAAGRM